MNDLDVEFIYTYVPLVWYRTYHKILELLVCYGEKKVINPKCKCAGGDNTVLECYDLFQCAIAAYNLDKQEEGQSIIDNIESLLRGYESANSFTVVIDGKTYLFEENGDIICVDD